MEVVDLRLRSLTVIVAGPAGTSSSFRCSATMIVRRGPTDADSATGVGGDGSFPTVNVPLITLACGSHSKVYLPSVERDRPVTVSAVADSRRLFDARAMQVEIVQLRHVADLDVIRAGIEMRDRIPGCVTQRDHERVVPADRRDEPWIVGVERPPRAGSPPRAGTAEVAVWPSPDSTGRRGVRIGRAASRPPFQVELPVGSLDRRRLLPEHQAERQEHQREQSDCPELQARERQRAVGDDADCSEHAVRAVLAGARGNAGRRRRRGRIRGRCARRRAGLRLRIRSDCQARARARIRSWIPARPRLSDGRRRRAAALPVSLALQSMDVHLMTARATHSLVGLAVARPVQDRLRRSAVRDRDLPGGLAVAVLLRLLSTRLPRACLCAVLFAGFTPSLFAGSDSARRPERPKTRPERQPPSFFNCPGLLRVPG